MGVTIGGFDFKNAISQFENRNVKSATAQIIDGDGVCVLFIQAVS